MYLEKHRFVRVLTYLEKQWFGRVLWLGVVRPQDAGVGLHLQEDVHRVIIVGLPRRRQDRARHFREFWVLVLVRVVHRVRIDILQEFNSWQNMKIAMLESLHIYGMNEVFNLSNISIPFSIISFKNDYRCCNWHVLYPGIIRLVLRNFAVRNCLIHFFDLCIKGLFVSDNSFFRKTLS